MSIMKTKQTPTQSARAYAIRNFGVFWFTAMNKQAQRQVINAYVAGHRKGKNGK